MADNKIFNCDFCGINSDSKDGAMIKSGEFTYKLCRPCIDIHKVANACNYTEVDIPIGGINVEETEGREVV